MKSIKMMLLGISLILLGISAAQFAFSDGFIGYLGIVLSGVFSIAGIIVTIFGMTAKENPQKGQEEKKPSDEYETK